MEYLDIITLFFIGLGAFVLQWKKDFRFVSFINLLLTTVVVLIMKRFISPTDYNQLYALIAAVGTNFVFAQLKVLQKEGIRILVPIITFGTYFLMFNSDSINVLHEEYSSVNKFIIAGAALSILAYEFGLMKRFFITKLFHGLEVAEIIKSVMIFFMALAIFFGGFGAGSFGFLIVASIFISTSFYRKDETLSVGVSFLSISLFAGLLTLTGETEVNLINADVLEGLFVGVFGAYFIGQFWSAANRFMLFLAYLMFIVVSFGLLFLLTIYGQMGGMDAFVGVLVGTAVVNIINGKEYVGQTIFPLLLIGGLLLPSFMTNEALENFESQIESSVSDTKNETAIAPKTLNLTEIVGTYKLEPSNSNVLFSLGKKGETKGAFKKVTGTVTLGEDITKSTFAIELAMEHFTTFNSFRDESLMEDEYFKADKFPTMSYKGTSVVDKGNDNYEIIGKFTMLGISKDIIVSLNRIEKEGMNVISGKGTIDRRDFGMAPSATEGNTVTFEYECQLIMEN
ncbi:MAG: YceI family protein [Crocinitomicaceae bacterium]